MSDDLGTGRNGFICGIPHFGSDDATWVSSRVARAEGSRCKYQPDRCEGDETDEDERPPMPMRISPAHFGSSGNRQPDWIIKTAGLDQRSGHLVRLGLLRTGRMRVPAGCGWHEPPRRRRGEVRASSRRPDVGSWTCGIAGSRGT